MNKADYQAMFLRLIAAKKQFKETYSITTKGGVDCVSVEPISNSETQCSLLTKKGLERGKVTVQVSFPPKQPKKEIPVKKKMREIRYIITKKCPYHCPYCHEEGVIGKNFNKELLTPQDYAFLFKTTRKLGIKSVTITGGEPTTRQDLLQILKELKKNGAEIKLGTNGYLILQTKKIWGFIDSVHISLDTLDKNYYEKLSGVPNSFEKLIQGINFLAKITKIKIKLNSVSIDNKKSNSKNIPLFLAFAKKNNAIPRFLELFPSNSKNFISHESLCKKLYKLGYVRKEYGGPRKTILYNNQKNCVELIWMDCAIATKQKNSGKYCRETGDLFLTPSGKLKYCRFENKTIDLLKEIKTRNGNAVLTKVKKAFSIMGKNCKMEGGKY